MQNHPKEKQITPQHTDEEVDNVDKIRDILFGQQIKDIDQRFEQLQNTINKQLDTLRDESKAHFDSLEKQIKSEMNILSEQLVQEQNTRIAAFEQNSDQFKAYATSIEKQFNEQQFENRKDHESLQKKQHEQSQQLYEVIDKNKKQHSESLSQASNTLNKAKIDKSVLSQLFSDLAIQISDTTAIKE
jgi:hypothetical protein